MAKIKTPEQFVAQFTPEYCIRKYDDIKTIREASLTGYFKLREVKHVYGRSTVHAWLIYWIVDLCRVMDFEIDDYQIEQASMFLYDNIYMLNVSEVSLFFKKVKSGEFGIFYGKFNLQTLLIAAIEYRKQRGLEISKMPSELQEKTL